MNMSVVLYYVNETFGYQAAIKLSISDADVVLSNETSKFAIFSDGSYAYFDSKNKTVTPLMRESV